VSHHDVKPAAGVEALARESGRPLPLRAHALTGVQRHHGRGRQARNIELKVRMPATDIEEPTASSQLEMLEDEWKFETPDVVDGAAENFPQSESCMETHESQKSPVAMGFLAASELKGVMEPTPGLEPGTCRLRIGCSTN
jgi:hypothetical protein